MKRSLLVIDIGNTRLKWCIAPIDGSSASPGKALSLPAVGSFPSANWMKPDADALLNELADAIARHPAEEHGDPVSGICVARVGPTGWEPTLQAFADFHRLPLHIARSVPSCGLLQNGYADPSSLGVDRFLSAVAVAHTFSGQAAVIVSAGTATTIDAVDARGNFLGGYILPGPDMMSSSLHRNTAQLPRVQAQAVSFPVTTEQAIAGGIIQAQAGAVLFMKQSLQQQTGQQPLLLLTGGARHWLRAALPGALECDNLVLQGLAIEASVNRHDAPEGGPDSSEKTGDTQT